jgi:hypothetical protein
MRRNWPFIAYALLFPLIYGLGYFAPAEAAPTYREPTTREIVLAIRDLERQVSDLDQRVEHLEDSSR